MIDHYDINGLIIFLNRGMFVLPSKEDEKIIISLLMGFFPPHHRSRSHQTL